MLNLSHDLTDFCWPKQQCISLADTIEKNCCFSAVEDKKFDSNRDCRLRISLLSFLRVNLLLDN